MGPSELLPEGYDRRDEQLQLAEECRDSLVMGQTYFAHAPCGLGKSLASLMAAMPLLNEGRRLFVTYRTRSQLGIYLKELRRMDPSLVAVSTISRRDMCPRLEGSYGDFHKSCSRLKRNTRGGEDPYCPEFRAVLDDPEGSRASAIAACSRFASPTQFSVDAADSGICPYESLKLAMPESDVFLGTYHYLLDPAIRSQILNSLEADMADLVIIGDEAHNIPGFARSLLSTRLTGRTLDRSVREAEDYGQEEAIDVLRDIGSYYTHLRKTTGDRETRRVSPGELAAALSTPVDSAVRILNECGESVWRQRFEEDGSGFSSLGRTGGFLSEFCGKVSREYAHLASIEDGHAALELSNLDGRAIVDPVVSQSRAAVFMSGTLSPVDVYHGLTTSAGAVTRQHRSPFPRENRVVLVARDVSSKKKERTDRGMGNMAAHVEAVCDANEGNLAVFATSYSMMSRLRGRVSTGREVLVEERGGPVKPVLQRLASTDDALVFGVMGGKLSEGVDYEGDLLTGVVAAGFPYPPWSEKRRALIEHLDDEFDGRGRLYGYLVPAITRMLQTCGRVHRSATDRGPVVVLDRRVTHRYLRRHLPGDFSDEMRTVDSPGETALAVERFWR